MFKSIFFTGFFCLIGIFTAVSQAVEEYPFFKSITAQPEIVHYTRDDFHADAEFWTACTNDEGMLFFGNNDGILIYDGTRWDKVALPNSSSVRTLLKASDGTLYAGGYNEFGTVSKDSLGVYHYNSLLGKFDLEGRELENLEQAHELNGTIIFRFFKELIVVDANRKTHIPSTRDFMHGNVVNDVYYVQDMGVGILSYRPEKNNLDLSFPASAFGNEVIKGLYPTADADWILIITEKGVVLKGNIKTKEVLPWDHVFPGAYMDQIIRTVPFEDKIYVGTLNSKVRLLNTDGHPIEIPATYNQIQNPTVLNILPTTEGTWLMLNNGLDYINENVYFQKFSEDSKIYDLEIFNNKLYLATSKGVYFKDLTSGNREMTRIDALQGQSWSLTVLNNRLFIGHHKGLHVLDGDNPVMLTNFGIWKVTEIPGKSDMLLACGYSGLYLIQKVGNTFELIRKISGFTESTRDILPTGESGTYWVCHGYKGIFKIRIDDSYDHVYAIDQYTNKNGLESQFNINVFKWNGQIVFSTNTGIYTFNEEKGVFEPFSRLNDILDRSKNTRKILEYENTTWVVQDDQIGYFLTDDESGKLIYKPFLRVKGQLNRGMESILPINENQVLIGSTDGVYLFQMNHKQGTPSRTQIQKVTKIEQQKSALLPLTHHEEVELPTQTDAIRFDFAVPKLTGEGKTEFQYMLVGAGNGWSDWQIEGYKEYSHLRPGSYTFRVRARDVIGNVTEEASYAFDVMPEWYQTTVMKILFLLGFAFVLWLGYLLIRRSIEKENEKEQLQTLKEKRLLELEVERLKLQNDKERIEHDRQVLENDVLAKSKELANYTMQLVNKKDIFNELQSDLKELRNLVKSQLSRQKVTDIFRKLHQHKIGEEYMEVFDVNFEKVHYKFFENLNALHPNLSRKDQRLCAFIKMDLSNKEISPLLNISVRGVETLRYRVRKKLSLDHDDKLTDYLKGLE